MHIRYHISCMYRIMNIYGLMRIHYHVFRIYVISYILKISHVLTDFWSSDLPIFHMTWPHTDPMPYIFTYTAFYGPVQLIRPYSYRFKSNRNSLDTLPLTSPYSYLLDMGDIHYFNQFLISPNIYAFTNNIES